MTLNHIPRRKASIRQKENTPLSSSYYLCDIKASLDPLPFYKIQDLLFVRFGPLTFLKMATTPEPRCFPLPNLDRGKQHERAPRPSLSRNRSLFKELAIKLQRHSITSTVMSSLPLVSESSAKASHHFHQILNSIPNADPELLGQEKLDCLFLIRPIPVPPKAT